MTRRVLAIGVVVITLVVLSAAPSSAHSDGAVDDTHLPVGKTVTAPTVGGLWTCQTQFSGGGAQIQGPWFSADGTWDATKKTTVDGDVAWPNAKLTVTKQGNELVLSTNDLPIDHTTGVFPVSPSDDAYQVDRNPNTIAAQSIVIRLPLHPKVAAAPSCVRGEVGILESGVALFDAVDAGGRDAVAYEVQDHCQGHPQMAGEYHYHSVSTCVLTELDRGTGQSKQVGWAFDGFGIYGPRDARGHALTDADLDKCHGVTSTVVFNGKKQRVYHYVATQEYPYTVGCFRGTSAVSGPTVAAPNGSPSSPPAGGPPPGSPPPRS
jgi:hypothetical protein